MDNSVGSRRNEVAVPSTEEGWIAGTRNDGKNTNWLLCGLWQFSHVWLRSKWAWREKMRLNWICSRWLLERRGSRGSVHCVMWVRSLPNNTLASRWVLSSSHKIPAWRARFLLGKFSSESDSTSARHSMAWSCFWGQGKEDKVVWPDCESFSRRNADLPQLHGFLLHGCWSCRAVSYLGSEVC